MKRGPRLREAAEGLTNALPLKPIEAEDPHELVSLHFRDLERPDSYRSFSYPNFVDIRDAPAGWE